MTTHTTPADPVREALAELVGIINAAGLLNLANGVQLGPTAWYIKANTALKAAERALAQKPVKCFTSTSALAAKAAQGEQP